MDLDPKRQFDKYQRQEIWDKDGPWCGICGYRVEGSWDADHIVPWSVGGRTEVYNGQVSHPSCNRAKKAQYQRRDGGPNWSRRWGQKFSDSPF